MSGTCTTELPPGELVGPNDDGGVNDPFVLELELFKYFDKIKTAYNEE